MTDERATVAAFLRGLNVGGHRVKMDYLRSILSELGLDDPRSLLASGNVVFRAEGEPDAIERQVEEGLRDALGYDVDTFVRSGSDVRRIVSAPFHEAPMSDEDRIHVLFLKGSVPHAVLDRMRRAVPTGDEIGTGDREVYWLRRGSLMDAGIPDPTRLGGRDAGPATMRTLNTVRRLADRFFAA